VERKTSQITVGVELEGLENVTAGMEQIGNSASKMGDKVQASTEKMHTNYRTLMFTTAGMITNTMQLADITDRLARGQMDLSRGVVMLGMNFLQLAGQIYVVYTKYGALITAKATALALSIQEHAADIAGAASKAIHTAATWANVVAENARAVASGIANAVASLGITVPIMLAATAAVVGGILAYQASIPKHHYEGSVLETRPYLLEKRQI